jgi:hypothetical protein
MRRHGLGNLRCLLVQTRRHSLHFLSVNHTPAKRAIAPAVGVNGRCLRLGQFHDDLIKNGSLQLSSVEWILLDDATTIDQVLK